MIVYVVEVGEYEDVRIESVWSTRAGAEARRAIYDREHGSWSRPGQIGCEPWRADLPAEARCIADGARVLPFTLDRVEGLLGTDEELQMQCEGGWA